ncbi:hypothetical protein ACFLUP_02085 [Chloroflexota bacterium]
MVGTASGIPTPAFILRATPTKTTCPDLPSVLHVSENTLKELAEGGCR